MIKVTNKADDFIYYIYYLIIVTNQNKYFNYNILDFIIQNN